MNLPPISGQPVAISPTDQAHGLQPGEASRGFALGTEDRGSSPTTEPSAIAPLDQVFDQFKAAWKSYGERLEKLDIRAKEFHDSKDFDPKSPEYVRFQQERMQQLYEAQLMIQRASFGVETAAKVIEHATSGVRTALQTQT